MDGQALLQAAIEGDFTREDPLATDAAERFQFSGHEDRVRVYGCDVVGRLRGTGLAVVEPDLAGTGSPEDMRRFRIPYGGSTHARDRGL